MLEGVYPQIHILYKYKSYIYWIFTRHKYSIYYSSSINSHIMSTIVNGVVMSIEDFTNYDFK